MAQALEQQHRHLGLGRREAPALELHVDGLAQPADRLPGLRPPAVGLPSPGAGLTPGAGQRQRGDRPLAQPAPPEGDRPPQREHHEQPLDEDVLGLRAQAGGVRDVDGHEEADRREERHGQAAGGAPLRGEIKACNLLISRKI